MTKKYVIGHQNPDTDSVVSAIMMAWALNEQGGEYIPAVAGPVNKETQLVLSTWGFEKPKEITKEQAEDKEFFLVDHNEIGQSVAKEENICGVVDHHLLGGIRTSNPIYFRSEPVGSSATLVYKIIKEQGLHINKQQAGLLLSAIISDTLNLNSPTTVTEDIDTLYELKEIADVDTEKMAQEMFAAKSDFSDKDMTEVLSADLKEYDFGGQKIGVGVCETTSLDYFEKNKEQIKKELQNLKQKESFDALFFAVIDIIEQNTYFYLPEEEEEKVIKEVFKATEKDGAFFAPDISSRKKEIAPPLSEYYK